MASAFVHDCVNLKCFAVHRHFRSWSTDGSSLCKSSLIHGLRRARKLAHWEPKRSEGVKFTWKQIAFLLPGLLLTGRWWTRCHFTSLVSMGVYSAATHSRLQNEVIKLILKHATRLKECPLVWMNSLRPGSDPGFEQRGMLHREAADSST